MKPIKMIFSGLAVAVVIAFQPAFASLMTIDTNAGWRSFDAAPTGWNDVGFDTSGWRNAYEGYSAHPDATYTNLVDAKTVWDWPGSGVPSGSNGPLQAYFRYELTLDSLVENAQFAYAVDDAMALFVNGVEVYAHVGAGNTNTPGFKTIDDSLFSLGENVIAIAAWDGSSSRVYNRGNESITARFQIETTPVAEPSPLFLLTAGLILAPGVQKLRSRLGWFRR